jgi:hypothetical protein
MKQGPSPIGLPTKGVRPWSISSLKYYLIIFEILPVDWKAGSAVPPKSQ